MEKAKATGSEMSTDTSTTIHPKIPQHTIHPKTVEALIA
jgi:hypothetical protein